PVCRAYLLGPGTGLTPGTGTGRVPVHAVSQGLGAAVTGCPGTDDYHLTDRASQPLTTAPLTQPQPTATVAVTSCPQFDNQGRAASRGDTPSSRGRSALSRRQGLA